jgi:hypothetical protein
MALERWLSTSLRFLFVVGPAVGYWDRSELTGRGWHNVEGDVRRFVVPRV